MRAFFHDLRFAVRALWGNPGFTSMALLTLALGIGANAAIFSLIDDVLLRPLQLPEPERVVQILEDPPHSTRVVTTTSVPKYQALRDRNDVFEAVAAVKAYLHPTLYLEGSDRPQKITALVASSQFLPVLGVKPLHGRGFLPGEDVEGTPAVVLLTHAFWQRQFAGNPDIVGQTLASLMPDTRFDIIGVLPPEFEIPPLSLAPVGLGSGGRGFMERPQFDILISMGYLGRRAYDSWGSRLVAVLARLKPGVTLPQAQANVDSIVAAVADEAPAEEAGYGSTLLSLPGLIRRAYGTGLYFLWSAAGFVLLLVCVNVANLMLARAVSRQRELGVRRALGAGRGRLLSLLLAESTVLGMTGGALGLLVALWGSGALVSLLPSFIYRLDAVGLDARVLVFSFLASLATAFLVGLLPAARSCRPDLQETLKEGARGAPGGRLRWLRVLVVAQVAIALLLLTSAGLMLSSFRNLTRVETGFERENLLLAEVEKLPDPLSRYEGAEGSLLMNRVIERVEAFSGVTAAAGIDYPPLAGLHVFIPFALADRPPFPEEERETAVRFLVSPGYFRAMQTPVSAGRSLTEADQVERLRLSYPDLETAERIAAMTAAERLEHHRRQTIPVIINETMASRYWPQESPLGKGFYDVSNVDQGEPTGPRLTVVGVVPEVRTKRMDEVPWPQFYMPTDMFSRWLVIRTEADPDALIGALRTEIQAADPTEVRMTRAQTMDDLFRASTAESRSLTLLVVGFAALSTALAAIGLFGVMAYSVACRTHEIGVRMSMGARPGEIFRLILGQGMILAATGVGIGLLGSIALTRFIASLLFGVSPLDWGTLLGVSLLLAAVAVLACYLPTRHASKVDPLTALRSD